MQNQSEHETDAKSETEFQSAPSDTAHVDTRPLDFTTNRSSIASERKNSFQLDFPNFGSAKRARASPATLALI